MMPDNEEVTPVPADSLDKNDEAKNVFSMGCTRYVAFISNFLCFILGAALVCLGAWFLFEPTNQNIVAISTTATTRSYLKITMYLAEASGACTIILALVGFCTAVSYERNFVRTFYVILAVQCLQLTAVVSMDLYIRQEVEDGINTHMVKSMMKGYLGDSARNMESVSWRKVQREMKCCGYSANGGYKDYTNSSQDYPQGSVWWQLQQGMELLRETEEPITKRLWPDSCCIKDVVTKRDEEECHDPDFRTKRVFRKGCREKVKIFLRSLLLSVAATATLVGFIEVIHFATIRRMLAIIEEGSAGVLKTAMPLQAGCYTGQADVVHEQTGEMYVENAKSK